MITISIKALGPLKKKIENSASLELSTSISIFEMLDEQFNLKHLETSRFNFVVNGKVAKGDYLLQNEDSITILKMGGAG